MSKPTKRRAAPFSLRFTQEERQRLENLAGSMPLGTYIRARLFEKAGNAGSLQRRTRGKFPVKDHKLLAQLLARLGASRLASNLNQLARAANSGSLSLNPDTESALKSAARDIASMKRMLMTALGIAER